MDEADYAKISLLVAVVVLLILIYFSLRSLTHFVSYMENGLLNLRVKMGLAKRDPRDKPPSSS